MQTVSCVFICHFLVHVMRKPEKIGMGFVSKGCAFQFESQPPGGVHAALGLLEVRGLHSKAIEVPTPDYGHRHG